MSPVDGHEYSAEERLRDGGRVTIRAIRPEDKPALVDLFGRLSADTIYYRFLGTKKRLTANELVYLTELDFHRQAALVAVLEDNGGPRIVGVGRYVSPPSWPEDRAEVALTVEDAEQGRGIGTQLLRHLMRVALAEGITVFDCFLFSENARMIELLERTGLVISRAAEGGLCHLAVSTRAGPSSFPSPPSGSGAAAEQS